MKAVIYSRCSTQEQSESVTLQAQCHRAKIFCELNGYEVIGSFSESMSGGKASNRPQLMSALDLVCSEKAVLVVYSLSRLSRNIRDTLQISDRINKSGAHIASLTEKIDTNSAVGRLFYTLIVSLAEFEKSLLSERTCSSMKYLRKKDMRISSRIPLGYDLAPDGKSLVQNPEEQVTIRQILNWKSEGDKLSAIANKLESSGMKTKYGGKWYAATVKYILEREAKLLAA